MSEKLMKRLDELLTLSLHGNCDDFSYYMRYKQEETVKLIKKALTPPTVEEIIKEFKMLKNYKDTRIEYLNGNFVYYPMDRGSMKNTYITIAGSDLNGFSINARITEKFAHKITMFFINRSVK
jgi:hypothetical protein